VGKAEPRASGWTWMGRLKTLSGPNLKSLITASWGGPEAFRGKARVIEILTQLGTRAILFCFLKIFLFEYS